MKQQPTSSGQVIDTRPKVVIPYYEERFFEEVRAIATVRIGSNRFGEAREGNDPEAEAYELIAKLIAVTKVRPDLRAAIISEAAALTDAAKQFEFAAGAFRAKVESMVRLVEAESVIEPKPEPKPKPPAPREVAV